MADVAAQVVVRGHRVTCSGKHVLNPGLPLYNQFRIIGSVFRYQPEQVHLHLAHDVLVV